MTTPPTTALQVQAEAELERRRRRRRDLPIAELVADLSIPTDPYERPDHLGPLLVELEQMGTFPVRTLSSVPPRHAKTETILHTLVRQLLRKPTTRIAYVSYGQDVASDKSRRAQALALRAGVRISKEQTSANNWKTTAGGGVYATSIGGPLTSLGFEWLVIDDPHKNRAEAESSLLRNRIEEWFTSTAMTRLEPGGSVLVNHTRWHPDDLIGRLSGKGRWSTVNLPAVSDLGEALWPGRWPIELLNERRDEVGPYDWNSLYLGRPRIRGGTVFHDVRFFAAAPAGLRIAIGVDFAYTAKTSSDWSVAVVVGEKDGILYVLEVLRRQVAPPIFAGGLATLQSRYPGAPLHAYVSGTEMGTIEFLAADYAVHIIAKPASTDKFQRAQPTAAKWNASTILVFNPPNESVDPEESWQSDFVSEVLDFTGIADAADDQVDALASACDALTEELTWDPLTGGDRRW